MKRLILSAIILFSFAALSAAEEQKPIDPNKLFYSANSLYEKREYEKALDEYNEILESGIDSGPLYYNMGNTYFKMGKLGRAILYYAKARRLEPYDTDLKSNLNFARSLVATSTADVPRKNPVVTFIKAPFRDFNFNAIALSALALYLIFIALWIAGIINPIFWKKARLPFALISLLLIVNLGAFAIRYYDEKVLHHAIVVQKNIEAKYEPIDKSTTFYRLQEGEPVSVVKTREGWRQIKRIDGKIGWVRQEAVEEI